MVEIIIVIQPKKLAATKAKLIEVGFPAYTCQRAKGRGRKPRTYRLPDGSFGRTNLVNKRILNVMVPDSACDLVVQALLDANCTGTAGDGKIFICPVEKTYKVRTGTGEEG